MYQYPASTSAYRLIPAGKFYSTRRNGPVLGIVLHITAGLQDLGMDGTDSSAESVAKWAASGNAKVSWHVGVDSDSIVPCLPATYTAWHAAGYNSRTFGIEISKLNVDWSTIPAAWVTATLKNAARALAPIVVKYRLPLALRSKAQVDAAVRAGEPFGFVYHSSTSAGTRSDPGKNFPVGLLFDLIRAEIDGAPAAARTVLRPGDRGDDVRALQLLLIKAGAAIEADGSYGPATEAAVKAYQTAKGLEVDGIAGPATHAALKATAPPTPVPVPTTSKEPAMVLVQVDGLPEVYVSNGITRRHIPDSVALADLQRAIRDQGGTGRVTEVSTVAHLDAACGRLESASTEGNQPATTGA